MTHPLAGKPVPPELRPDIEAVVAAYYAVKPDPGDRRQTVHFGTSGHRGVSRDGTFNEAHVLAITQALCQLRKSRGIGGPLYLGRDTHALSAPAEQTALEVLVANGVEVRVAAGGACTPTPAVSHAILAHNRRHGGTAAQADGIVVTPSHNPPGDGGIKYNPPHGGPADTDITAAIARRANHILTHGGREVKRTAVGPARRGHGLVPFDFVTPYVADLATVVDLAAIRAAGLHIGVDALGGASLACWPAIADRYGLNLDLHHASPDPAFAFMPADHDGQIRMDCSSPYAMAGLTDHRDRYDIAFGNDPDADRHGIVTRDGGLLTPNLYLAVAIAYLFRTRPAWGPQLQVGKTVVSSSLIDRAAAELGRAVFEVPVGFKWFVEGLAGGTLGFGGEESAGASFLRLDGTVWTTEKDGILLALLAAEILARTGRDPWQHSEDLRARLGDVHYERIDQPLPAEDRLALARLGPRHVRATALAGDPVTGVLTRAPGNGAEIGGVKVTTQGGWFAARPSGTENVFKLYVESFRGAAHLARVRDDARQAVAEAIALCRAEPRQPNPPAA
ncbi:MAG: Phosphoglucomutase [Lentisphaerae bacterium ADurb.BinA184]|nr:MAG: Phosphoglucomutase [Lentisphaerae bacterium ADurb.BinA184]